MDNYIKNYVVDLDNQSQAEHSPIVTGYIGSLGAYRDQIVKQEGGILLNGIASKDLLLSGLDRDSGEHGTLYKFKDPKGSKSVQGVISPRITSSAGMSDSGGKLAVSGEGLNGGVSADLGFVGHKQYLPVVLGTTRYEWCAPSSVFSNGVAQSNTPLTSGVKQIYGPMPVSGLTNSSTEPLDPLSGDRSIRPFYEPSYKDPVTGKQKQVDQTAYRSVLNTNRFTGANRVSVDRLP